ncbi:hypothetical protein N7532_002295 [Penicillium argentinense]|uniref:Serine/threonine-protein kinase ATG1 n=1 Tax=Penicillium argentinense TaxID=1131581 RepID=A0A9W9KKH2_9EURO|nr:uncharacterized protein N7532_002295 [Penicillium argentinense]KAJ5109650.1 hypothetical protein N7532_002295 [Penicillium argentinense]
MSSGASDLVLGTKLRVEFDSDVTHRITFRQSSTVRREERKDAWKKEKKLGSGSYGSVWLHRCMASDCAAKVEAVKMMRKQHLSAQRIDFYKELEAIAKFSLPEYRGLFVEYRGWYESDEKVFIAMEYIEHGDLSHLIMPLLEDDAREITFQIAEALEHLHKDKFVHRDLKPANVFVVQTGPQWWVKIGDFGFSKRIKEGSSLRSFVGTRLYAAPEILSSYSLDLDDSSGSFNYSEKVDIWSLGVMAFQMVFNTFPFMQPTLLPKYIRGEPLPFPEQAVDIVGPECRQFIVAAMAPRATDRLSATECLESEWLKQGKVGTLDLDALEGALSDLQPGGAHLAVPDTTFQGSDPEVPSIPPSPRPSKSPVHEQKATTSPPANALATDSNVQPTSVDYKKVEPKPILTPANGRTTGSNMQTSPFGPARVGPKSTVSPPPNSREMGSDEHSNRDGTKKIDQKPTGGRQKQDSVPDYLSRFKDKSGNLRVLDCNGLFDLAKQQFEENEYGASEYTFKKIYPKLKEELGEKHERVLKIQYYLGRILIKQGRTSLAKSLLLDTWEKQRKFLGSGAQDTMNTVIYLEQALRAERSLSKLVDLFRKHSKDLEKVRGPEHQMTYLARYSLARALLFQRKRLLEAEKIFRETYDGQKKLLGPKHPDTLQSFNGVGEALFEQQKYEAASRTLRSVAEQRLEVLGAENLSYLWSMKLLGLALYSNKNYKEAEVVQKEVYDILSKNNAAGESSGTVVSPKIKNKMMITADLISTLKAQGKAKEAGAL